jgi:hypothetical protein
LGEAYGNRTDARDKVAEALGVSGGTHGFLFGLPFGVFFAGAANS